MPITVYLEMVADGTNTLTIQNWSPESPDYKKFWDFTNSVWNIVETADTKLLVDTPEFGQTFSATFDISAGVSAETLLRCVYRDSAGDVIATEVIRVDASGNLYDDVSKLETELPTLTNVIFQPDFAAIPANVEAQLAADFAAIPGNVEAQLADDFAAIPGNVEAQLADDFAAIPAVVESQLADEFAAIPSNVEAQLDDEFIGINNRFDSVDSSIADVSTKIDSLPTPTTISNQVKTDLQPLFDALPVLSDISQEIVNNALLTDAQKEALLTVLGIASDGTIHIPTAGIWPALTEVLEDGTVRFKSTAVEKLLVTPAEMSVVKVDTGTEVTFMYSIKKQIEPPPEELNIVKIRVHRSSDPNAELWPVETEIDYEQGQSEIEFISPYTGYFRLGFVDADGDEGELSEPFSVSNNYEDIDLTFSIEPDSKTFYVGDMKFLTINVTESSGKISALPMARVRILDSDGNTVVPETAALSDGMQIKYLLNTEGMAPGMYRVIAKVITTFEVIQSKPLMFKIKEL